MYQKTKGGDISPQFLPPSSKKGHVYIGDFEWMCLCLLKSKRHTQTQCARTHHVHDDVPLVQAWYTWHTTMLYQEHSSLLILSLTQPDIFKFIKFYVFVLPFFLNWIELHIICKHMFHFSPLLLKDLGGRRHTHFKRTLRWERQLLGSSHVPAPQIA